MSISRQFWILFTTIFIVVYIPTSIAFFSTSTQIFTSSPAQSNSIHFTSQPADNLTPKKTFNLTVYYSVLQPVQFIQAVIQFDKNVLKPILPVQKLHTFPYHEAIILPDNNTIRISGFGINPNDPKAEIISISGTNEFTIIKFEILPTNKTSTSLKLLIPAQNTIDWRLSKITYLDENTNPVNLTLPNYTLNLNIIQPSPSPSPNTANPNLSPSPSPSPNPSPISPSNLSPIIPNSLTGKTVSTWDKLIYYFKFLQDLLHLIVS